MRAYGPLHLVFSGDHVRFLYTRQLTLGILNVWRSILTSHASTSLSQIALRFQLVIKPLIYMSRLPFSWHSIFHLLSTHLYIPTRHTCHSIRRVSIQKTFNFHICFSDITERQFEG
jgi:hypothetical protein